MRASTIDRRSFLGILGGTACVALVPLSGVGCGGSRGGGQPGFLDPSEIETLEALVDRILPPDRDPGARSLGAARFIDRLLSAFDGPGPPRIYGGGPLSGRHPYPDAETGLPSDRFPGNDFERFLPLDRLQTLRWRAELHGTAATPGADFNDAELGPRRGLREIYREALARIDSLAVSSTGDRFSRLSAEAQDALLPSLDDAFATEPRRGLSFMDIVIQHTLEGCFAAPEYGGNREALGWRFIGFEGDVHPLGYSVFSIAADDYVERPDAPMSVPNPDELTPEGALAPRPLGSEGRRIQLAITAVSNLVGGECDGF